MTQKELPQLPDFQEIENSLPLERKAIITVNGFSEQDEDYVRSPEDAQIILHLVRDVQTLLWNFFNQYPSLIDFFEKDFIPFLDFIQRENVLDLCFLDDCLFPEKDIFYFGQDGGISKNILDIHRKAIEAWVEEKKATHLKSQEAIIGLQDIGMKSNALPCSCQDCLGVFRTKLREVALSLSEDIVKQAKQDIENNIDAELDVTNEIFHSMQKALEKNFYKVRFNLRRSTINRLETQIKNMVRDTFNYPSELAVKHIPQLKKFLKSELVTQELKEELLDEEDYHRFFKQLGTNFWRNERYLEREFKKTVKSILILKRKDISGKILTDYLGEFWVHSQARTIKRKIIYHMGPTNSGKTYYAIEALSKAQKGCYLAPLRLLAGELYDTLNLKGIKTTLLTGEEILEVKDASHFSSTIEMAQFHEVFDCCVIDEIQMIADSQRGWAWTRALVNIFAPEIHVCGDPSAYDLVKQIADLCGDELEVKNYERMTKLVVEKDPIPLGSLVRSDALIVFSRRNALRYKADLERLGFKVSIVYGRLSPEVRREQARKFDIGETDILVSTDAIAMGMNLPIRRIVFSTLSKFIDSQEYPISESEIKQIAGRAGRYKRFPTGYVNCIAKVQEGAKQIQDALSAVLDQQTQCMVGPDLDIFNQVNTALRNNGLPILKLSEFLRLFNNMKFQQPFFCVDLKEMIELTEMVEEADTENRLSSAETFGFACAPVNLGLIEHVHYYISILSKFVQGTAINYEPIDNKSGDIDYLETSIKCIELYQWLSRHFNNKHFSYDLFDLLENKNQGIERLNSLLSEKIVPTCSSCGVKLDEKTKFNICEECFKQRKFKRRGRPGGASGGGFREQSDQRRSADGRSSNDRGRPGKQGGSGGPGKGRRPFDKRRKRRLNKS